MDTKIEQPKTDAEIIFKKKRGKNKIKAVLTSETIQTPLIKDIMKAETASPVQTSLIVDKIEVRFTF